MKECKLRKTCEVCGKEFGRKKLVSGRGKGSYSSKKLFMEKRTCGNRSCATTIGNHTRAKLAIRLPTESTSKNYLNRRCSYPPCNALLMSSRHSIESEKKKRDEEKRYCNGQCAAKHKAMSVESTLNQFLYGVKL